MPLTSEDKLLIHLPTPAPPGWLEAVAERFPALNVVWRVAGIDPSIPDIESVDKLPADVVEGVTLLAAYAPFNRDIVPKLRYVQLASAGYDRWVNHPLFLDPKVAFCNGSGAHCPQIAEWVIGTWLSHNHHFRVYAEQQLSQTWQYRAERPTQEATGRRMGILGYGAIGRQCARLAQAFGVEIYAYTQSPRLTAESKKHPNYCVPGTGDQDGLIPAKWFSGPPRETINEFLAQDLDMVVVCLPLHASTRGLLGAEQFEIMGRRKAFLSNIGRGAIVDTDALVEALQKGVVGGAALDVTDPEPLPKGHALWTAPNVFITPHVSWSSTEVMARVADIMFTNLGRLEQDLPPLNLLSKS